MYLLSLIIYILLSTIKKSSSPILTRFGNPSQNNVTQIYVMRRKIKGPATRQYQKQNPPKLGDFALYLKYQVKIRRTMTGFHQYPLH